MDVTPEDAIDKLSEQRCPMDNTRTTPVIVTDEDGSYAFEICAGDPKHTWRYEHFNEEWDTNVFEGDFDPAIIEELLEEYSHAPS